MNREEKIQKLVELLGFEPEECEKILSAVVSIMVNRDDPGEMRLGAQIIERLLRRINPVTAHSIDVTLNEDELDFLLEYTARPEYKKYSSLKEKIQLILLKAFKEAADEEVDTILSSHRAVGSGLAVNEKRQLN